MGVGGGGVENLKNWDLITNVGLIGNTSAEDTRLLGGPEACFPGKFLKFEILNLIETHRNCQSHHHHIILYYFKSFTTPSGGPFRLLGRLRAHPAQPRVYGPGSRRG